MQQVTYKKYKGSVVRVKTENKPSKELSLAIDELIKVAHKTKV